MRTTHVHPTPAGRRPQRRGFTLVEILMVVLILGITAAVVMPQISSRNDLKAAGAARVVMADLIYAQNRAIALQQDHYVVFDTANNRYTIYVQNPTTLTYVVIANPITKNNYVTQFGAAGPSALQGVTLTSAAFDAKTTLKFDSLGQPWGLTSSWASPASLAAQGQIKVTAGTNTMTITVEPYTGELNVQ